MTKIIFTEIETERLLLRKPSISDWPVVSYLRSDEEVNKFVKRSSAKTKEEAIAFIEKNLKDINSHKIVAWFISEKSSAVMIGSICLWNFSEDKSIAEVGYDLKPEFQGRGIMDEALKAVIAYGFNKLSLDKIEAFTGNLNENSKKLLIRNHFLLNPERRDESNPDNIIFELENN
ncbi:MAG: GNAT family N-acetyltransferase [Christiangramia sp.]